MTDRRQITFTLQLDSKHDWHAIRRLLKNLLRGYRLKCIAIQPAKSEQEPPTQEPI